MKKIFSILLLLAIAIYPITIKAEGTVEEIRITSTTTSVTEGELPSFTVSTTTEHINIEAYGSNTGWTKWATGNSSWHGFGSETPTAEADGTTHYGLRLSVQLETGYTFADEVTIYFNDNNVTEEGHTLLDTGFDWGGYLYIDLGIAEEETDDPELPEDEIISSVNITITPPQIGTKVEMHEVEDQYGVYTEPTLFPTVVLEKNAHYKLGIAFYISTLPSIDPDGYDEPFVGTFEANKDYYMEVYVYPEDGYIFADNVTLTVNGGTDYELSEYNYEYQLMFYVKMKASTNDPKVLEGAGQEYTQSNDKKLVFKFDIPFEEFKNTGKVYIDGKLVDPKNYNVSEGSTVITFNTDYTNTLASGNHTLRVTSENGDISTTFSVSATKNPNTNDNILTSILTLIISIFSVSILLKYNKKILSN